MRCFLLFFFMAALASAQIVSVGLKGGVPLTDASPYFSATSTVDTGRWTIGPTVELRLIYGFSLEADALYRGYRKQQSFVSMEFVTPGITYPATFSSFRSNTKAWDIPLLLKYRIGSRSFKPFLDAGYTWTHSTSDVTSSLNCLSSADKCAASSLSSYFQLQSQTQHSDVSSGPTAGVGLEVKRGWVRIAPEIRYTHFSNPTTNQVTLLVGFTF
ncbi:MAG TPA: outer membrane beta-barrel protein [Bryobacteraceae bacterium]|nr:outer membrane beta-barrel protein [Bryobacteraceae bacterium]